MPQADQVMEISSALLLTTVQLFLKLTTLALIGFKRVPLPLLRIKDNAVPAGLSQPLDPSKVFTMLTGVSCSLSLNNKCLIVIPNAKLAMDASPI